MRLARNLSEDGSASKPTRRLGRKNVTAHRADSLVFGFGCRVARLQKFRAFKGPSLAETGQSRVAFRRSRAMFFGVSPPSDQVWSSSGRSLPKSGHVRANMAESGRMLTDSGQALARFGSANFDPILVNSVPNWPVLVETASNRAHLVDSTQFGRSRPIELPLFRTAY